MANTYMQDSTSSQNLITLSDKRVTNFSISHKENEIGPRASVTIGVNSFENSYSEGEDVYLNLFGTSYRFFISAIVKEASGEGFFVTLDLVDYTFKKTIASVEKPIHFISALPHEYSRLKSESDAGVTEYVMYVKKDEGYGLYRGWRLKDVIRNLCMFAGLSVRLSFGMNPWVQKFVCDKSIFQSILDIIEPFDLTILHNTGIEGIIIADKNSVAGFPLDRNIFDFNNATSVKYTGESINSPPYVEVKGGEDIFDENRSTEAMTENKTMQKETLRFGSIFERNVQLRCPVTLISIPTMITFLTP